MRNGKLRLIALLLAAALLLSGCELVDFGGYFRGLKSVLAEDSAMIPFDSMEYSRPDLADIRAQLDTAICTAESELNTVEAVVDAIYSFYDGYDWFYTCYSLADIHYSADLTDIFWEKEYTYCQENSGAVDAMLEELYYALAQSPHRQALEAEEYFGAGYFDSYDGENLWDEEFVALLERESELQNRYYTLSAEALDYESGTEAYYDACAGDMAQLLVELVALRQEMAAYWGYTDYVQFANDFYYYRDYTPAEMAAYLAEISRELAPLYCNVTDADWEAAYDYSTEKQTLAYVRSAAKNMGGIILEAFELMEDGKLYDISYGPNKYNSSFEVYLTSYWEPFVFMNPTMSRYDCLTFAHEFGHFCNDYASYGSYAGIDVMEVFSQGMEYLSLCYSEEGQTLVRSKMADSLCVYVEQAAYAAFEQRMYALTGDDLSVEGLCALYEEVAREYGFESVGYDPREFITITHYYTNPMYVISYVVSNDAAMQLYQLERETTGAGLKRFEENLDTQEVYFLEFVDTAGLESPLAEGRVQSVRKIFEETLGS